MFGRDAREDLEAIGASQAVISFAPDGTILAANENFCRTLGYESGEVVGRHHSMFVTPEYAASPEYKAFWEKLRSGQFDRQQYKRVAKGGREIWIEASYNPVLRGGKVIRVVKTATEITAFKVKAIEDEGKLAALSRSQAVIEFTPDGIILDANENFCNAMGYAIGEIRGKHHSIFCDRDYAKTPAYTEFWRSLASGKFHSDEFVRYAKGGKPVWIQAAYNPLLDDSGKVYKVVKFATDVTARMASVDELGDAISRLSQGNLTVSLDRPLTPSMEKTRTDFNAAVSKLRKTVGEIYGSAEAITANAHQLQESSNSFALRMEQQAASVEETAAALEQVTTTVQNSSVSASEAGRLVASTRSAAEKSGSVVDTAIDAMGKIKHSSDEISNIIGVIDEIAFQTNLLALNAGVEAARAGDAGKGFAVVAQEVRELAQRSAKAAKEIKQLITTSSDQVQTGVALVHETGAALSEIVGAIGKIDVNVGAIVESAREQAIGLKEINTAVNQMDQGTQQNAATVEETTAANHSISDELAALLGMLAQFDVGDRRAAPAHATKTTARAQGRPLRVVASSGATAAQEWQEF